MAEEDTAAYLEFLPNHPIYKVQKLMIDPRLLAIADDLRPGRQ